MSRHLIATFTSPEQILQATRAARERGHTIVDAYTPFAVHGLEEAMGLRPSRLTWACFVGAVAGLSLGMGFQVWSSATDWPLNVGGKPLESIPAFVPVAFELTILFAGLTVFFAMLVRSGLRPGRAPKFVVPGVTDDRFALVLLEDSATFSPEQVRELFTSLGAVKVEEREEASS